MYSPVRLNLDSNALVANWSALATLSGTAGCGAVIKANGYGLGARAVMDRLADAGCRDFFVATWAEALALGPIDADLSLSILHGVREADMPTALAGWARPVLNTSEQVARWREAGGGACDVMIDTGMNRLGLDWRSHVTELAAGLNIQTLISHLACADEDVRLNAEQLKRFTDMKSAIDAERYSLANSAGICLGSDYCFDLTRPGLALYGGRPRDGIDFLAQVVRPQAQILQRRRIMAGDSIGYNATFIASHDMETAILNIGYADGYIRAFSGNGVAFSNQTPLPVLGRVSMDLLIIDVGARPDLWEGDWIELDYRLPETAALTGLSQYELLTNLGDRFDRIWS